MNSAEQKSRLKEIINEITEVTKTAFEKAIEFQAVIKTFDTLEEQLEDILSGTPIDVPELKNEFLREFFEDLLADVEELVTDFVNDIEEDISEASEKRAEKLEEKYSELELVAERFSYEENEYESIEELYNAMNDVKLEFKEMLNGK